MNGDQWFFLGSGALGIAAFAVGVLAAKWQPDRKGKAYAKALADVASVTPKVNPWFDLDAFELDTNAGIIRCRTCAVEVVSVHYLDRISSLVTVCLEHTHVKRFDPPVRVEVDDD